ncbi:hypothetical protein H6F44_18855 [Pseudanabaena sp. FACHB-1277]|uniref:SPOR domain-containing protein n=1 Tax=Pseudanabaena cinerea FACHB-1277 TaxID=2949581 RepID=A0A926Z800_9CYAN|nr:hypothetical protein [Pseudanabaena cinerea]MBD2152163.1 hypothetical protein [Pseudanabaena cinerea FACHB-1277]
MRLLLRMIKRRSLISPISKINLLPKDVKLWVFLVVSLVTNSLSIPAKAIAQVVSIPACPQISNRAYVVIFDRAASLLPPLPEFLAIAAVPCHYLNTSMTFLGGFDNASGSSFRANQLRELGVDAVVHSFTSKLNDVPANLQASVILTELNSEPNLAMQQVRSLTGKNAILATFNNRSVLLAAPLSSPQSANAIANRLRSQGIGAQVISAALISPPLAAAPSANSRVNSRPLSSNSSASTYRVLVPRLSADTLNQVKAIVPDAFATVFQGKAYIQARTYSNRDNANRERDRLNIRFPGTILIQD